MKKKYVFLIITIVLILLLIPIIVIILLVNLFKVGFQERTNEPQSTSCNITGNILVDRNEYDSAKYVIDSLFNALEAKDAKAIKELFSEHAKANASNLDEKIIELINFYPGAESGYKCNSQSHNSYNYGTKIHALDLVILVDSQSFPYRLVVSMCLKDDTDPSKIGVHLIEASIRTSNGFYRRSYDDPPGVYVVN